jgi:hypothetical protein
MNGVHDMGGMDGFGKVEVEQNEPPFHAPWEGRVLAMQPNHVSAMLQIAFQLIKDVFIGYFVIIVICFTYI